MKKAVKKTKAKAVNKSKATKKVVATSKKSTPKKAAKKAPIKKKVAKKAVKKTVVKKQVVKKTVKKVVVKKQTAKKAVKKVVAKKQADKKVALKEKVSSKAVKKLALKNVKEPKTAPNKKKELKKSKSKKASSDDEEDELDEDIDEDLSEDFFDDDLPVEKSKKKSKGGRKPKSQDDDVDDDLLDDEDSLVDQLIKSTKKLKSGKGAKKEPRQIRVFINPKAALNVVDSDENSKKKKKIKEPSGKFVLEYLTRTSPAILYEFLTTPSGLSEWFADDVNILDGVFTFFWDGSEQKAKLLGFKDEKYIKFQWLDKPEGTYFEFRIEQDEMTGDISLLVTDFADEESDLKTSKLLWDSQINDLLNVLGSY